MNKGDLILPSNQFGKWLLSEIAVIAPIFRIEHGAYVACYTHATLKLEMVAQSGLPAELCVAQAIIDDVDRAIKLGTARGQELGLRCRVPVDELGPEVADKLKHDYHEAVLILGQVAA